MQETDPEALIGRELVVRIKDGKVTHMQLQPTDEERLKAAHVVGTRQEDYDVFKKPVDISTAPDNDRIKEAISDAVAYGNRFDKDWFSPHDEMELWQRADDVFCEEYGLPKRPFPIGGVNAMIGWDAVVYGWNDDEKETRQEAKLEDLNEPEFKDLPF